MHLGACITRHPTNRSQRYIVGAGEVVLEGDTSESQLELYTLSLLLLHLFQAEAGARQMDGPVQSRQSGEYLGCL